MMPTEKHHRSKMKTLTPILVMITMITMVTFVAIAYPRMINDMQDVRQDVVDSNEERCKSIGAKLKTIDGGFGAADTYMCTTPDGTIVEVPEG